jgi:hypothetical protein
MILGSDFWKYTLFVVLPANQMRRSFAALKKEERPLFRR